MVISGIGLIVIFIDNFLDFSMKFHTSLCHRVAVLPLMTGNLLAPTITQVGRARERWVICGTASSMT